MSKQIIWIGFLCVTLICAGISCTGSDAADGSLDASVIEATIGQYFQYVNNEQLDDLMNLYDENAVFNFPMGYTDVTGLDNIRAFYSMVFAFDYHRDNPLEIFIKGNQAAVLIDASIGPNEADATFLKAMSHMIFNPEGKLSSVRAIFDSAPLICPP